MKVKLGIGDTISLYYALEDVIPRKWIEIEVDDTGKLLSLRTNRGEFDLSTGRYPPYKEGDSWE